MSVYGRGALSRRKGSLPPPSIAKRASRPPASDEAERYLLALEAIDDGVWDWDLRSGRIYCSPAYFGMLGYPAVASSRRYEDWLDELHPDDRAAAAAAAGACVEGRIDRFGLEFRMRTAEGGWLWVLGRGKAVARGADGRCLRMVGTHVDIGERKKNEATIKNLATQKEFLLRELQHRVKNSIALLQSMIQLQGDRYPDGSEAHEALVDAAHRVQGLAALYARLYDEGRCDVLETRAFFEELIASIHTGGDGAVRIEADLCSAELRLDALSPLGIIATELITNAMKYASPPGEATLIRVRTKSDARGFELIVSDGGPGLPEAAAAALRGESSAGVGFGLSIVRALADQIGARVQAAPGSSELRVFLAAPAADRPR